MNETVVVDTTCLIGLERIQSLFILPALYAPVCIPPEVASEFGSSFEWLEIKQIQHKTLIAALQLLVDVGEAEAIALASEQQSLLISDDKQARSVAKKLGIRIIGTIGVLVQAKRAGIIPLIKPLLTQLELQGFFISEHLREEALRISGE